MRQNWVKGINYNRKVGEPRVICRGSQSFCFWAAFGIKGSHKVGGRKGGEWIAWLKMASHWLWACRGERISGRTVCVTKQVHQPEDGICRCDILEDKGECIIPACYLTAHTQRLGDWPIVLRATRTEPKLSPGLAWCCPSSLFFRSHNAPECWASQCYQCQHRTCKNCSLDCNAEGFWWGFWALGFEFSTMDMDNSSITELHTSPTLCILFWDGQWEL